MSESASFTLRNRNPDVLTCIANLSNDEVFTPPEFANQVLDALRLRDRINMINADRCASRFFTTEITEAQRVFKKGAATFLSPKA